ncbi:hypothetical protein V5O48_000099 [Marasmius crinis-equi]|uniref:RlpA-like protein double-psi beta-barrel domain-containing protein n=1 Tax=Marasmius crinis-equi TaxID=585013 RepID=A0ABR3G2G9_9AGAR
MYSRIIASLALSLITILHVSPLASASALPSSLQVRSYYSRPHSLGNSYVFQPRDGWTSVNATNLQYKYRRDVEQTVEARSKKHKDSKGGTVHAQDAKDAKKDRDDEKKAATIKKSASKKTLKASNAISKLNTDSILKPVAGSSGEKFRATGEAESVTITWYTGQDLLRPSCWADEIWAPTDSSFVCAVTMEGWKDKPQCFKFLELCNGPEKCVFVRVVDTCAGCDKGSKHVDLTKSAFTALADLDQGRLNDIQMRPALELPLSNNLW